MIADAPTVPRTTADGRFAVKLTNFEGPFDLLLQLISKHRLDVTEVALSVVTDEFIDHIKAQGSDWDLDQASQFLVVAATLLDLKAARLLPHGEVEDDEDLALLEARDLLFARLLQYRAFKRVAAWIESTLGEQGLRFARPGGLEERYARMLPEVQLGITPAELTVIAAKAMEPKAVIEVSVAHLHQARVSVAEQAQVVADKLRRHRALTFRALVADAPDTLHVVARFLSLLELFRAGHVAFDQVTPLGELVVRWAGDAETEVEITDEFDGEPPAPEEET